MGTDAPLRQNPVGSSEIQFLLIPQMDRKFLHDQGINVNVLHAATPCERIVSSGLPDGLTV